MRQGVALLTALSSLQWYYAGATIQLASNLSASMPCCLESLGISTCARLRKRGAWFTNKCQQDADFAIIQCCHTCKTNVLGAKLFSKGSKSLQCFDRHGPLFCNKFLQPDEITGISKCSGANASFGFRLCRRSCGFCEPEIYEKNRQDSQCPLIG